MPEDKLSAKKHDLSNKVFWNVYSCKEDDKPSETCGHEEGYFGKVKEHTEMFLICLKCGDVYNLSLINKKLGHTSFGITVAFSCCPAVFMNYIKSEICLKIN